MSLCSINFLKSFCVFLGAVLLLFSVAGIGFCLFMLFGDPFASYTYNTYSPNWENIAPAFLASVISLLANICLIGGAKQQHKDIILFWLVWQLLLIILFWSWYIYSQLKYTGWIDWSDKGMRTCLWCDLPEAQAVGMGGALSSFGLLLLMVPVFNFYSSLKKRHRELTEYSVGHSRVYQLSKF